MANGRLTYFTLARPQLLPPIRSLHLPFFLLTTRGTPSANPAGRPAAAGPTRLENVATKIRYTQDFKLKEYPFEQVKKELARLNVRWEILTEV